MTKVEGRRGTAPAKGKRAKASGRARILLVDDDERNLLALSEVLDDLAEVVTASSGREALRALLHGDFAVILLDVFMPDMDGYETAGVIRERGQTARIPIIFLSAVNKETEHLMKGYAMGAVDYVFKPVDPMILKSKVSVFVDLFTMRMQIEEKSRAEQQLLDQSLRANSEKLEAERALRAAEERHSLAIRSLPIILFSRDLSHEMTPPRIIGGDLARITGFAEPPTIDDWRNRVHPDDRERVAEAYRQLPELGNVAIEYRWRREDGETRHFLEHTMVFGDGAHDPVEIAGTIFDVTDQKNLEAQLVQSGKMDAIGQLTGGIAHDFNNLLAAVLGGIHFLQRRITLDDREKLVVEQMRHAAEQGAELVRRMMAFARKQDLTPTSIDPKRLCESVAGLVEHAMGGIVTIDWQCPETRRNLYADKSQLELALVNLVLNARDAMPDGGEIQVKMEELDELFDRGSVDLSPGEYLCISVRDEGGGIPADLVNRVTEPFFTTKEAGKGTGLGLSMVVGFVQQSGGKMRIRSDPGKGTTIDLFLPSTAESQPAPISKDTIAVSNGRVKSVLLVDDDHAVRIVLSEQLRELGLTVETVSDGQSAINLLRDQSIPIDLLLTDFAMPGKNGVETIRCAQEHQPDLRAVLMTGYADDPSVSMLRRSIPILRKPIDLNELMKALS